MEGRRRLVVRQETRDEDVRQKRVGTCPIGIPCSFQALSLKLTGGWPKRRRSNDAFVLSKTDAESFCRSGKWRPLSPTQCASTGTWSRNREWDLRRAAPLHGRTRARLGPLLEWLTTRYAETPADPLVAISVSEPGTGSDVAAVALRATPATRDGEHGWRLNGVKTWSTFAGKAGPNSISRCQCRFPALGRGAVPRCRISGSRSPVQFFVNDRASTRLASITVPSRSVRPATTAAVDRRQQRLPRPCLSSRRRKFRTVVFTA